MLSFVTLGVAIDNAYDIVKLLTVPEIQVYEELRKLYLQNR